MYMYTKHNNIPVCVVGSTDNGNLRVVYPGALGKVTEQPASEFQAWPYEFPALSQKEPEQQAAYAKIKAEYFVGCRLAAKHAEDYSVCERKLGGAMVRALTRRCGLTPRDSLEYRLDWVPQVKEWLQA